MLKKIIGIVVSLVIAATGIAVGYYYVNKGEAPMLICNGQEITSSLYKVYMIDEAMQLDYSSYESVGEYINEVRENAYTRICIDSYYQSKCNEEEMQLTMEEKQDAQLLLISSMMEYGFNYDNMNSDKFVEYFNVTKQDFLQYFERKLLYNKYFEASVNRSENMLSYREIRRIPSLVDRLEAEKEYSQYVSQQNMLETEMNELFDEDRWEYAKNSIEFVIMDYKDEDRDENGNIPDSVKSNYLRTGDSIVNRIKNGEYYHKMPEWYPEYVTNISLVQVDSSSTLIEAYGEELVRACLYGNENDVYKVECENAVVVFRVLTVYGREENQERLELAVMTRQIANQVRKAIIGEEYEPNIVDKASYDELLSPQGGVWDKLLEK